MERYVKKKMSIKMDHEMDRKRKVKQGSKKDMMEDRMRGVRDANMRKANRKKRK